MLWPAVAPFAVEIVRMYLRSNRRFTLLLTVADIAVAAGLIEAIVWLRLLDFDATEIVIGPVAMVLSVLLAYLAIDGYSLRRDMLSGRYAADHLLATIAALIFSVVMIYVVRPDLYIVDAERPSTISRLAPILGIPAIGVTTLLLRRILFARFTAASARSFLTLVGTAQSVSFVRDLLLQARFPPATRAVVLDPMSTDISITRLVSERLAEIENEESEQCAAIVLCDHGGARHEDAVFRAALAQATTIPMLSPAGFYEFAFERVSLDASAPHHLRDAILSRVEASTVARTKRAIDIVLATVGLLMVAPVILLAAIAVKLESRGPVFFHQIRVGLRERRFTLLKMRTMHIAATPGSHYTSENDPRVTRVGYWLRRHHLDELPQLLNVIRGDLSLIGPRPEMLELAQIYEREIPHYSLRYLVRPGLTGLAQIKQRYGSSLGEAKEKLEHDLYYIKNMSLALDFEITLRTIFFMMIGMGR